MKKIFLTLTLVAGFMATAQVKIGANPTVIDGNSLLELETTNQGLLYPRVALTSTTSYAPLNSTLPNIKQPGMTVYNTATSTNGTNDVTPGLYVNDGFNWIRVTPTAPKTLYTDDSAITSARTVTLNNNNLTFTAGVSGTGIMGSDKLKIGANPTAIDANSLLELETTNKGLLFPRILLENTTSYSPLNSLPNIKQAGMTVYNTATTGDVTPGLYTNDGTNWVKVTPKTLYTDNGTLTGARTVTQNNNDLTFTTGTAKTIVDGNFQTKSFYGKVRNIGSATTYTVLSDDYMIVSEATSTITLPAAASSTGRIIIVVNNKSTAGTVTVTGDVQWSGIMTITQIHGKQYFSDGTRWYSVSYN